MTHYLCQFEKVIPRLIRKHTAQFHADTKKEKVTVDLNVPVHHILWNTKLIFPPENMQSKSMFGLDTKKQSQQNHLELFDKVFSLPKAPDCDHLSSHHL